MAPRPAALPRFALALGLALAACADRPTARPASADPTARPSPKAYPSVLIGGVPHVRQKPDFCGEAAAASWLGALGLPADQDRVFDLSGMDPARGMGATTRELRTALLGLGMDPGPVWSLVPAADTAALDAQFDELYGDLGRHTPSIVCMRYDERPNTTEHFRLVLGYDASTDEVVYHEPAEDDGGYRRMPRARFIDLWPLRYEADRWTVIRLRLAGAAHVPPAAPGFDAADYAQHVMGLAERVPAGFSTVVEPPFVVIGDGGAAAVQASAESTVRWAVSRLERDFFPAPPARILDIWLFQGAASYEKNATQLFGEAPSTPYGWYSRRDGALVMNIGTGGGTLVHEIVHPFVEANFRDCPAWINEGLGSLFEQSADRDGHIVGLANWRLPGLQRAIRAGKMPSLRTLTATSDTAFYDDDSGLHYAEARYLLYYLQEHGLLTKFFREAMRDHATDRSGWQTLVRVLGERDMDAFERRFEAFVLGLRF